MKQTDCLRGAETGELIPGLSNSVILDCILPRLPWHARVALVATSKAWKCALREPRIYSELSRRAFDVISRKGVVLLHQLSEAETLDCFKEMNTMRRLPRPHALSILDPRIPNDLNMCPAEDFWICRRLPPIPAFAPLRVLHDCGIACINGQIFVIGGWDPCTDTVCGDMYMLDIAAGLWKWETMPPMHFPRAFFHCISGSGKIYVVGGTSASHIDDPDPDPEVYNVRTHAWELLPRVVMSSRSLHYNGVSFIRGTNLVVTHGFCTTQRGELVRFKRSYNPVSCTWCDYECEDEAADDDDDVLEDGFVSSTVYGRRDIAIKHENVTIGSVSLSRAGHRTGVIRRVMMK